MPNPHLTRVLEWVQGFERGSLTLTDLWKNLALIPSVLESDVPLEIRAAIQNCANDLEVLDETTDGSSASAAVRARERAEVLASLISHHLGKTE